MRLRGAAGITLAPLDPADVAAWLRWDAGGEDAAARWEPVVAALGRATPVGRALRTPLLAGLARAIYNPRPDEHLGKLPDPAELCDQARFPTSDAIAAHLFAAFVPAAYRPHPDPRRQGRWTPNQASRWLIFLARHLDHTLKGTTDLGWWHLSTAVPRLVAGLAVGLAIGLGVGLAVGLMGWLTGGLTARLTGSLWVGLGAALVGGLWAWLAGGREAAPVRGLRWSFQESAPGLAVGLAVGLVSAFQVGLLFGLAIGLAVGLVGGLAFGLAGVPADPTVTGSPGLILARDRSTFLGLGLALGLALGLVFASVLGLVGGLVFGLPVGLGAWLGEAAWGRFAIARGWLALRRRLPWRLMRFLADAHERGLLRQAGAVYQFRHVELQHHLASRPDRS